MTTLFQIQANRQNAMKSTGPRTEAGKQKSAQNAQTHGLSVSDQTLLSQNSPELTRLLASYTETYNPQNEAEQTLVRELALATLRLRRIEAAESQLWEAEEVDLDRIGRFERYRSSASRCFHRTYKTLEALKKERHKAKPIESKQTAPASPSDQETNHMLDQIGRYLALDPSETIEEMIRRYIELNVPVNWNEIRYE